MHPRFGISQSIARKEDDALLRGNGRYVADHAPPGTLHAGAEMVRGIRRRASLVIGPISPWRLLAP